MAECSKPDKDAAGSNNKAGSATEDCPIHKWIKVTFIRKKQNEQPSWWPNNVFLPLGGEGFSMELTNGIKKGKLSSQGSIEFRNIPSGSCKFECPDFYNDIEKWMRSTLKDEYEEWLRKNK